MALLLDEIRLTRDASRYGFAVGKVRVLEARSLDAAAYERLLDARSLAEQKRLLSETPYGRYIESAETAADVETGLAHALDDAYAFLRQAALPDAVVRFFRLRYDFANLKAALKAQTLAADTEGLLTNHGSVPAEAFEGDLSELPEPMGALAQRLLAEYESSAEAESLAIDSSVDQAMFAELLKSARASRSSFLTGLARLAIDLANARTLIRAARAGLAAEATVAMLAPGGSMPVAELAPLAELTPREIAERLRRFEPLRKASPEELVDPSSLDVTLDAVTTAALRTGRMGQVGPEPVIAYVFAREAEIAALRVLLLGKLARLDRETVRRRLRHAR